MGISPAREGHARGAIPPSMLIMYFNSACYVDDEPPRGQARRARENTVTWHELFTALERTDPASEGVVVLYRLRGASEVFALEEAQDTGEYVRLAIYEDEPVAEGCGHDTEG
jgi:hypothetical protein